MHCRYSLVHCPNGEYNNIQFESNTNACRKYKGATMSSAEMLPAPEFQPLRRTDSKWYRERHAFLELLPSLLNTLDGKFVAIHEGQVVGVGEDQVEVALQAYRQFGYLPIYVGLVTDRPKIVTRQPSPKIVSQGD